MPYKDPEKRREAFKKYYEKNKEKVLEKNRQWWVDNPERAREINARSHRKMRGMDIEVEPIDPIEHDAIDEALEDLMPIPKPKPEPIPKPEIDEEALEQALKELKEEAK